jgi:DNA-binding NtrC family response regulator
MVVAHTILIVEDDTGARTALVKALEKSGYRVLQASNGEQALQVIAKEEVRLVLCDIKLPAMDGLEVLTRIKKLQPQIMVVMMTAFGSVEKAVKALKTGAMDFLEKPLDLEMIRSVVETALQMPLAYTQDSEGIIQEFKHTNIFEGMVGGSRVMHDIFDTIIKIANARTTVLISGETGTGKELVARAIHNNSHRSGPFIVINLAAVPDTLIESELFGHVKGAHSTAFRDRKGRLAEAEGGTLFLDEVGDIPENIQVKLLRALENRTYERLGENTSHKVDVRFIAATNINLEEAVATGKFRQDLYYRLKVLRIALPPLREHAEDIPLLAQTFLQRFCQENSRQIRKISQEVMDMLCGYRWPGNIRELEKVMETAVVMSDKDTLLPVHLAPELNKTETKNTLSIPIGTPLRDVEREMIRHTLASVGGNKTKAAEILGIGTRTLYRKIEEYGLQG